MDITLHEFCAKARITEAQFHGKEKINGNLNLESLTSIPDGFNPIVGGYLDLSNLTSIPDGFSPTVGGYLDLSNLRSILDSFNPTVGGGLYLGSLTSIPDGFNPTVGSFLDLRNLRSIPDGFNPTVGGYLDLCSLRSIPDSFNPTVGGYLDLGGLRSIPDGFNPTVGGSLDLSRLTSIPDGFNPTVGSDLDLSGLRSIPDGFKFQATDEYGVYKGNADEPMVLSWQNGRYRLIDGMFCEFISTHKGIIKAKSIERKKMFYIVTDGVNFSHGKTIKEAQADLIYKISSRDTAKFKTWTIDTVVTLKDAIHSYRAITGACDAGVKMFVESLEKAPQQLSVREIIKLTKGKYGNVAYSDFFKANAENE